MTEHPERQGLAKNREELLQKLMTERVQEDETRHRRPINFCGDCAAYKTPFCMWADQEAYIKKGDRACSDFFPDRHLRLEVSHRRRRRRFDELVTNL